MTIFTKGNKMDNTTKLQVDQIIKQGWYRKSQTLGEGGWGEFYFQVGYNWKVYVLYGQNSEQPYSEEVEKIVAKDDAEAMGAFSSLYHLDMFVYWEVQEKITEFRLVSMKVEE